MPTKTEKLLTFIFVTRIALLVLPWLTITLLFPEQVHQTFAQFTAVAWTRWDAPHYVFLAEHWYTSIGDAANFIVFFPLYPIILKPLILLLGNSSITAIFSSIVFFLVGSYFFYKLVAIDYGEKIARWATIAIAIFPTSYFFNAPYTESLFFLLFSVSLYASRRAKWITSGIFSGLATAARPYGFLVLITVFIEWLGQKQKRLIYLPIISIPSAIAGTSYLYLNKYVYGNFFEFLTILSSHWQKHFLSPFLSIKDSWHIALSGGLTNFVIFVGWAEALSTTISWILIPFAFKYLRRSWAIFYTLSIIIFSSTSFILSTPRYLLSVPPLFVLIALAQKNYLFKIMWSFVSVALLFCLAILFTRGQWAF